MPMPRKADPKRYCTACGKRMERKRVNGRLEDRAVFLKRTYCNRHCMARGQRKRTVKPETLHHRARRFRKDRCEKCGATTNLALHHKDGNPKNNAPSNRMTLCGSCHTRWHWEHGKTTPKREGLCVVCGMPARKLEWCQKHYQRFRKYGDPYLTKKRSGSLWLLVKDRG